MEMQISGFTLPSLPGRGCGGSQLSETNGLTICRECGPVYIERVLTLEPSYPPLPLPQREGCSNAIHRSPKNRLEISQSDVAGINPAGHADIIGPFDDRPTVAKDGQFDIGTFQHESQQVRVEIDAAGRTKLLGQLLE